MRPLSALRGLGIGLGSLAAFAGSLVLHVGTAPGRRLATRITNDALADVFRGRIVVDRVDHLFVPRGLISFAGHVFDPDGREIVRVHRASARFDIASLARSLVSNGPLRIRIEDVAITSGKVLLLQSKEGVSIADTFQPKTPSPDTGEKGKGVTVDILPIHLKNVRLESDLLPKLASDIRELRGEVHVGTDDVGVVLTHLDAQAAFGSLAPTGLRAQGRLALPLAADKNIRIDATASLVSGPSTAELSLKSDTLVEARVRAHADPTLARQLELPLEPTAPLDIDVRASGPFENVGITALVKAGAGSLEASGHLDAKTQRADAKVTLRELDAHVAHATAPTSRISGVVDLEGDGRAKTAKAKLTIERGTVAGRNTPRLDVTASADAQKVVAHLSAREADTKVEVAATLTREGSEQAVSAHATIVSPELARLRGLVPESRARGAVTIEAEARLGLTSGALSGKASGKFDHFAWADVARARGGWLTAELRGPLAELAIAAHVHGHGVNVAGVEGDRVDAGGVLRFGSLDIDQGFVELERNGTTVRADAARIRIGDGVDVQGARITGLGGPIDGNVRINDRVTVLRARGARVRLGPLARIGLLPPDVRGGGDLDVDLTLAPSGVTGHARITARGIRAGRETARGELVLEGHGRTLDVESHVVVDPIGRVDIAKSQVRIDGDPRRPKTWARAAGAITAETDLGIPELLARFLPEDTLESAGRAHLRIRLERRVPGGPFTSEVDLETKGLIARVGDFSMTGTELRAHGVLDDERASLSVDASDARGEVLALHAAAQLRDGPRRFAIGEMPIHATMLMPARSLDSFAFGDQIAGARTRAAAVLEASGSVGHPQVSGWLGANVEGLGSVRIDELAAEWDRAHEVMPRGRVVAKTRLDLAALMSRLGDRAKSLPRLSGLLDVDVQARREPGDALPSARVAIRTHGLRAAQDGTAVVGTDLRASVEMFAPTGELEASATAWDHSGGLVTFDAKARLPEAVTAASFATIKDRWSTVPMSARLTVPPRSIASLRALLENTNRKSRVSASSQLQGVEGGFAFEATAEGTVLAPRVVARGYGLGLRQLEPPRKAERRKPTPPLDATIYATYDGKRVDAGVSVIDQGRASLQGAATALISSAELVERGDVTVRASADVRAKDFRSDAVPILGTTVKGTFDANVMLRDYGEDARASASITGRNVAVANVRLKSAEVRVFAEDGKLAAALGLEQAEGGWAGAMLSSGLRWGNAPAPSLDDSGAVRLDYRIDKFRLSGIRPLVRLVLPELDGRVDGTGRISRDKGVESAEGSLSLRGGSTYLAALGQNIEDATLDLRLSPGAFVIENGGARVDRGELRFAASGRLDGIVPSAIRANVNIGGGRRDLPVYLEGVRYGTVSGEAQLDVKLRGREVRIDANVPRLRFDLAGLDPKQLQGLDAAEHVKIGVREPDGDLETVRLQRLKRGREAEPTPGAAATPTTTIVVATHLGRDVVLSQGTTLYVPLNGDVDVTMREEMKLRGRIALEPGGTINLKGRKFRVDSGTITWTGDDEPGNPVVIAAATWEAPEKTNVIASFTGPAQSGKLSLRSDPAHTNGEILSLLLFGTTDGRSGGGGGVAGTAASAGGGIAAGGLGQAISKLADVEIEAKVESPDARTTRPEVSVRVRPDMTIQVGANIGSSEMARRDPLLLTVDWRIAQRWSVQATGGRATSIFDLLWQYRY